MNEAIKDALRGLLIANEDEFCDFIRVYIGNDDFIALAKKLGFNDDAMRRISKVIEECESRASTGADLCDTVGVAQ